MICVLSVTSQKLQLSQIKKENNDNNLRFSSYRHSLERLSLWAEKVQTVFKLLSKVCRIVIKQCFFWDRYSLPYVFISPNIAIRLGGTWSKMNWQEKQHFFRLLWTQEQLIGMLLTVFCKLNVFKTTINKSTILSSNSLQTAENAKNVGWMDSFKE